MHRLSSDGPRLGQLPIENMQQRLRTNPCCEIDRVGFGNLEMRKELQPRGNRQRQMSCLF
jgi:hypothetical protein